MKGQSYNWSGSNGRLWDFTSLRGVWFSCLGLGAGRPRRLLGLAGSGGVSRRGTVPTGPGSGPVGGPEPPPAPLNRFRTCLDSQRYLAAVQKDLQEAALGITGTPTFIIGNTSPEGVEGVKVVDALPFATFDARLKELSGK